MAGMLAAFLAPLAPYALLCTVMVLADVVSAWQLGRRMRRKGVASAAGRLSSRRFGRVVGTLAKCYGALALAGLQGGSLCGYLGRGQYIAGNEKGVAVGLCGGI